MKNNSQALIVDNNGNVILDINNPVVRENMAKIISLANNYQNSTVYYTGAGSMTAPESKRSLITVIATYLSTLGYTLRSGGADTLFEVGCDLVHGGKEVYIPWKGFNGRKGGIITSELPNYKESRLLASRVHPAYTHLKNPVQKLHDGSVYQVLGVSLKNPSKFLLYYCDNMDNEGLPIGGARTAVVIAKWFNVPTLNLNDISHFYEFLDFLNGVE